ncbi:CPBP family intramembrane glutamic endopeptidase [Aureispira anguillae]|uniref:CPBP family intramembrane metalloprotease n=1 Tax=Aureispira anguillae TaxID=2864201 RepID=A0A916DVJ5_9BACT|nr:type II CAAX endopeptidase family protein [Aureispira anguillae]BDS14436.1 CPBP family intramembrane metalloprotease [Aureispira anguillae]
MESKKGDKNSNLFFLLEEAKNNLSLEATLFVFIWFSLYVIGMSFVQFGISVLDLPDFSELFKGLIKGQYLEYLTTLKIIQIVLHLFQYLVPALFFTFIVYKKDALKILYADSIPSLKNLILGLALIISIYPLISFIYYWNTQLLPTNVIAQDKLEIQRVFLEMNSLFDLFLNLLLLGLVAGVGEELLFRGILQRLLTLWTNNIHYGAILTGAIFSLMHFQLEGFFPRFILGVLFCYMLIFSGSIWLSVLIHILFNSIQVLIPYFYQSAIDTVSNVAPISPFYALGSGFAFAGFLITFIKVNSDYKYIALK